MEDDSVLSLKRMNPKSREGNQEGMEEGKDGGKDEGTEEGKEEEVKEGGGVEPVEQPAPAEEVRLTCLALHPKPETRNSKLETRNLKFET